VVQLAAVAAVVVVARVARRRLIPALAAVLLVEAGAFWWGYNATTPADEAPPPIPELAVARELAGSARVAGLGVHDLEPNTAGLYGLRDVNVYGNVSALTARYQRLIGDSDPAWHHIDHRAARAPAALDVLGVSLLVVGPNVAGLPGTELVHNGEVRLYRNPTALPRARLVGRAIVLADDAARRRLAQRDFHPDEQVILDEAPRPAPERGTGSARIVHDASDHVRVRTHADGPRVLVVGDTAAPGWTARLDGRQVPMLTAYARVRAVAVPAGAHTVEMRYRPPGYTAGLAISAVSVAVTAGALLLRRRRSA
jgi:hypothetical protein